MPNPSSDGAAPAPGDRRVAGLEEPLPADETVLWEGSPDRTALANHLLHGRKILLYFVLLAAWTAVTGARDGAGAGTIALDASLYLAAGAGVLGFCHLVAEVVRRTSKYLLTDRRVLLNVGFAFPKVINVPLERVDAASVRTRRDGTGLVTVRPAGDIGLGYALMWPHVRPWRLRRPEPALRGLTHPERVGELLADALRTTRAGSADEASGESAAPATAGTARAAAGGASA